MGVEQSPSLILLYSKQIGLGVLSGGCYLPIRAACAAAKRATGTRNGEQLT